MSPPDASAERKASEVPAAAVPFVDSALMSVLALGPLVGLLAALVLAWREGGVGRVDVGLFVGFWLLTLAGIELGYHRYFSHAAFRTGPALEAIFVVLGSMSFQGPAIWWAATHRKHHQHADRDDDPHSPHLAGAGARGLLVGLWDAHLGWNYRAFVTIRRSETWKHLVPDLVANAWLRRVNRGYFLFMAVGLALPALIGGVAARSLAGAWSGFLWGGLVRLFVVNHTVYAVNSLGHAFGDRPFRLHVRDRSTNNAWLALVTLGASMHHNHHAFPAAGVTRLRWWQLDAGGFILAGLERLGVVRDLKRPPDARPAGWTRSATGVVRSGDTATGGALSGLSARGVFVETPLGAAAPPVGARVRLGDVRASDGAVELEVDAVVERASWRGVGLRFGAPSEPARAAIARLRRRGAQEEAGGDDEP